MKRLLACLLILCMLFSLTACQFDLSNILYEDEDEDEDRSDRKDRDDKDEDDDDDDDDGDKDEDDDHEGSTPLLYKVTDDDGNVIWLFGSIHLGQESFYPLPDYVMDAYESADILAVEFDVMEYQKDAAAMTKDLQKMVYTDGTTIQDHISEDLYDQCVDILKENKSYNKMLESYNIVMWSQFIDSFTGQKLDMDASLGIDMHFLEMAHDDGKDIEDIESSTLQYSMLSGFSQELQVLMLETSVKNYYDPDAYMQSLEYMMDIWEEGDEDDLIEMVTVSNDLCSSNKLQNEYYDAVFYQRNLGMADYAEDALSSGYEVFICVGAGHVVGDDGLAELLEDRGYAVKIVD